MKSLILCDPRAVVNLGQRKVGSSIGYKKSDRAALEKLIEFKNVGIATHVWAVSVVSKADEANQLLTYALALGADKASVIVNDVNQVWDKFGIAKSIHSVVKSLNIDLIMCGCDKVGCSPVGSILASLLGINYLGKVNSLTINGQKKNVVINRDIGGGYSETISGILPIVVGVDLYIERSKIYPTFNGIKNAMHSTIEKIMTNPDPEINVKRMLFMKSEPNRIPVKVRSSYPKESSSYNRIRYITGRASTVNNSDKKEADSSIQGVKNLIELLEVNDLFRT